VYCEKHTKSTLCEQNVEFRNKVASGIYILTTRF
jgi:hypothetical protein